MMHDSHIFDTNINGYRPMDILERYKYKGWWYKKQFYFLYSILLWKIQQMSNVLIVKDADIVINARTANSAINAITLAIKDIVLKTNAWVNQSGLDLCKYMLSNIKSFSCVMSCVKIAQTVISAIIVNSVTIVNIVVIVKIAVIAHAVKDVAIYTMHRMCFMVSNIDVWV